MLQQKMKPNKIGNRVEFEIYTCYKLERLSQERMRLIGRREQYLSKIKTMQMCQN